MVGEPIWEPRSLHVWKLSMGDENNQFYMHGYEKTSKLVNTTQGYRCFYSENKWSYLQVFIYQRHR